MEKYREVRCQNICNRIPKPQARRMGARGGYQHYIQGDRFCKTCDRWFSPGTNLFCVCCHKRLRIKPKKRRNKEDLEKAIEQMQGQM
jgi:hypothetical protein